MRLRRETPLASISDGRVRAITVPEADVADVQWATAERTHATRFNGKRAIWVIATQKDNVNMLEVEQRLRG